ncbi:ent-kaurenoic acid oxidase [Iris pallida]|uniref:Ent-kaurenoic acid oxidase n=1 Tax=Iris pallida TaxID=29817 RepID=A0AAX6HWA0_IRIPA|nr:ent-kaurenoic acid oxidase [Iris pallida]
MGLPFIGETLTFLWYFKILRRPDDFIKSKKQKYGEGVGLYRSHIFGYPSIITCLPESNKFVLQSASDFHIRWPAPELFGLTSLVNVEGKKHTRLKSYVVNAINHPKALRRVAQIVQPRIVSSLRSWANKGKINGLLESKKMTFENICMMFASMEPGPLLDEIDKCFAGLVPGFRAYPLDFPGTAFHHARRCRWRLNAVFREELEKKKQQKESSPGEIGDLMDGLMQIKDEGGKQLTDDEVVDNIVSFVIAGYSSTSYALMWALYHLSNSPEVLRKLREENTAISKEEKDGFITMDDISQLKYTAKVVEETIRMANVAPTLFRVANRDIEYGGYTIPKGWQVVIWLRHIHTDPKNYDHPLSFIPERWDKPAKPGTFQVFGGGHRICAGNMLVRVQLTILLHHLSLGYKWGLTNPGAKIKYLPHPCPEDEAALSFSTL